MASGGASPALSIRSGSGTPENNTVPHGLSKLNNVLTNTTNSLPSTTPKKIKICVFCGASPGTSPSHMEAARSLARVFHENDIHLVYGGGTVGLMGEMARTLVSLSGKESVHGIIPTPLMKYEQGPDSTAAKTSAPAEEVYGKTTEVPGMHARKRLMAKEVDSGAPGSGFVALSGGYGTLEELMEVVTWNQLGIHNRGVVVFNVEGYWDGLFQWVRKSVETGFVKESNQEIIKEAGSAEEVVRMLREYKSAEGRFKLEWSDE